LIEEKTSLASCKQGRKNQDLRASNSSDKKKVCRRDRNRIYSRWGRGRLLNCLGKGNYFVGPSEEIGGARLKETDSAAQTQLEIRTERRRRSVLSESGLLRSLFISGVKRKEGIKPRKGSKVSSGPCPQVKKDLDRPNSTMVLEVLLLSNYKKGGSCTYSWGQGKQRRGRDPGDRIPERKHLALNQPWKTTLVLF